MSNTNLDVARRWAKSGLYVGDFHAKSSNGNMWAQGSILYSYATPIAHLVLDQTGRSAALVTTESYGKTTNGKHINAVLKALNYDDGYGRHGIKLFRVPFLLLPPGSQTGRSTALRLGLGYPEAQQVAANLYDYDERIDAEQVRLARARVYVSLDTIQRIERERQAFIDAFA